MKQTEQQALYSWQEACLEQWFAHDGRGIVEAVTGSGKTRLALEASRRLERRLAARKAARGHAADLRGNDRDGGVTTRLWIKIVVPTTALARQWNRVLQEFLGISGEAQRIGICGGGYCPLEERQYLIYVVNSARYRLAREILQDFRRGDEVFLIADECHHYVSGQNRLIFEFRDCMEGYEAQYYAMGLSATLPTGEDYDFLKRGLGSWVFRYGIHGALSAKTVCKYDIYHIEIPLSRREREAYETLTERMTTLYRRLLNLAPELRGMGQKELFRELQRMAGYKKLPGSREAAFYLQASYLRKSTACLASARIDCAEQLVRLLGMEQRILIFGERICQAEELYRRLQSLCPGKAGRYHSRMGQQANKNTLERFRNGEFPILISCRSLDEGLDIPETATAIVLSGTAVQRQRTQRLGRIIRAAEGKERAFLYYLHAAETSEDRCFLPEGEGNQIFEMQYLPEAARLVQEPYELAVWKAFGNPDRKNLPEGLRQEWKRCLDQGRIRSDWKDQPETLERKLENAGFTHEKNYWFCMKRLRATVSEMGRN